MTDKQALKVVVTRLADLYRNDLKILARLKALETIAAMNVPPEQRELWYKELDEQSNRCLQDLLAEIEDKSGFWAALLDDRMPDELAGIE